jgi:hypothetical protein
MRDNLQRTPTRSNQLTSENNTSGAGNRFLWWFTGAICAPFLLASKGTFFGLVMNNAQRASAVEAAP